MIGFFMTNYLSNGDQQLLFWTFLIDKPSRCCSDAAAGVLTVTAVRLVKGASGSLRPCPLVPLWSAGLPVDLTPINAQGNPLRPTTPSSDGGQMHP